MSATNITGFQRTRKGARWAVLCPLVGPKKNQQKKHLDWISPIKHLLLISPQVSRESLQCSLPASWCFKLQDQSRHNKDAACFEFCPDWDASLPAAILNPDTFFIDTFPGVVLEHRGHPGGAQRLPVHGGGPPAARPARPPRSRTLLLALCEWSRLKSSTTPPKKKFDVRMSLLCRGDVSRFMTNTAEITRRRSGCCWSSTRSAASAHACWWDGKQLLHPQKNNTKKQIFEPFHAPRNLITL